MVYDLNHLWTMVITGSLPSISMFFSTSVFVSLD